MGCLVVLKLFSTISAFSVIKSTVVSCYIFVIQMKVLGEGISQGDVVLSNHPCAGGSHLPDLTVITPV